MYFIIDVLRKIVFQQFDAFKKGGIEWKDVRFWRRYVEIWLRNGSLRDRFKEHPFEGYLGLLLQFGFHR